MTHLPAYKHKDEIISTVLSNRITIVTGETGSGKSTQIPQYILDHFLSKSQSSTPRIICTQPRRISAISLSQFVAKSRGLPPSSPKISYQIGGDRANVHPKHTQITYATTGILKEQLLRDLRNEQRNPFGYDVVIMDEVHERTVDVDVVLLLMKRVLRKYPNLKLVLMSATINAKHFSKYYEMEKDLISSPDGLVPIVNIPVRCFEVKEYYLEDVLSLLHLPSRVINIDRPTSDRRILDIGVKLIQYLHRNDPILSNDRSKSILVFLPGLSSIVELANMLDDLGFYVLTAHSTVPTDEQKLIFQPAPSGQRKVVISTNIAESSITVPDVYTVVDFCLEKQLQLNPITNCQSLNEVFSAKESCEQRKGRAGRCGPGSCYRILFRKQYNALPDHSSPEIQRTHISRLMLQILRMNVGTPEDILRGCLDPPHENLINSAYSELFTFEGIELEEDTNKIRITDLGLLLSDLPLDVRVGLFLLNCFALGLEYEGIVAASIISLDTSPIYHNPSDPVGNATRKYEYMNGTCSDILCAFNAYEAYQRMKLTQPLGTHHSTISRKARDMHLNVKKVNEIHSQVKIIYQRLDRFGIHMPSYEERRSMYEKNTTTHPMVLRFLILVICASFIDNAFAATLKKKSADPRPQLKLKNVNKQNLDQLGVYLKRWLGYTPDFEYDNNKKRIFFNEEAVPERLNNAVKILGVNSRAIKKIRVPDSVRKNDLRFLSVYEDAHYEPKHNTKALFRTKYAMSPVSSSSCSPIISRTNSPDVPVYFVPTQVRGKNDDPKLYASHVTRLPEEPGLLDLLLILFSRHIHYIEDTDQMPIFGITHHGFPYYFKSALTEDIVTLINFVRSHLQTFPALMMSRRSDRAKNLKVANMFLLLPELYRKQYEASRLHMLKGGLYTEQEMQNFHARAQRIHDVFIQKAVISSADSMVRKNCPCRPELVKFLDNPQDKVLDLPASVSKADRKVLHVVCDKLGLDHESHGKGKNRYLSIIKPADFSLMNNKMRIKSSFNASLEQADAQRMRVRALEKKNKEVIDVSSVGDYVEKSLFNCEMVNFADSDKNLVSFIHISEKELEEPDTFTLANSLAASMWEIYHNMNGRNVLNICVIELRKMNDALKSQQSLILKLIEPHHYYSYQGSVSADMEHNALKDYVERTEQETNYDNWCKADGYRFVVRSQREYYTNHIDTNHSKEPPYQITYDGTMAEYEPVAIRIQNEEFDSEGMMVCRALLMNPKMKMSNALKYFENLEVLDYLFNEIQKLKEGDTEEENGEEKDGSDTDAQEKKEKFINSLKHEAVSTVHDYHKHMQMGSFAQAYRHMDKLCATVIRRLSLIVESEEGLLLCIHLAWYISLMVLPFFPALTIQWMDMFGEDKELVWSSEMVTEHRNTTPPSFWSQFKKEDLEGMDFSGSFFYNEFAIRLQNSIYEEDE